MVVIRTMAFAFFTVTSQSHLGRTSQAWARHRTLPTVFPKMGTSITTDIAVVVHAPAPHNHDM